MDGLDQGRAGKELNMAEKRDALNAEDMEAFSPTGKVGLVAALNDAGEPHVALLSSLMARGPKEIVIGEFSRGLSKEYMQRTRRIGFLVMGLDLRLWRGGAVWTRLAHEGAEYVEYNRKPMFRYNTYFGINTVHYLDLAGVEGPQKLPMAGVVCASMSTMLLGAGRGLRSETPALSHYGRRIIDALASLNFLAYVDGSGFPRLIPVLQARTAGPGRLVFSPGPFRAEVAAVPDGVRVSLFSMNLSMESVLCFGGYAAPGRGRGPLARIDIDRVYNSMPTCHGQVFPARPIAAFQEA